jgi:subtilisin family serine protease
MTQAGARGFTFVQKEEVDVTAQTGKGVKVAVVDSGVDNTHPDIDGWCKGGAVIERWGEYLIVGDYDAKDMFGHGTAVASIIKNVAPDAEVYSVRVLGSNLSSKSEIIIHGLNWALEQGFHVLNCSFGTTSLNYLQHYKDVVDKAYCRNVLMVAACNNHDYNVPELPSAFPPVVSVDFLRGELADPLRFFLRAGHLIEFIARGDNLRLPWLEHKYITTKGSSFAAPHMTGIVCRLMEKYPGLRPFEVKTLLYHMAEALPEGSPQAKPSASLF